MAIYRVGSNVPIIVPDLRPETLQYPSSWFQKNPNEKPTANVRKSPYTLEQLSKIVYSGLKNHELKLETAKVFLYKFFQTQSVELCEDWISFNRVIGVKGSKITPWDVVSIVEIQDEAENETIINTEPPTNIAMVLYILGIHRLSKTNTANENALTAKINSKLKEIGGRDLTLQGARKYSWTNTEFIKMIAAIDMFYYRFKHHKNSIVRMGSVGARFNDCAAFTSMEFIIDLLGCKASDFAHWIFVRHIAKDFERVSKGGEESNNEFSYFPYQTDMKLVSKSAYSSAANKYLFHFCHLIGSLLTSERSINTRYNLDSIQYNVDINSICVAFVFGRDPVMKNSSVECEEKEKAFYTMTGTDGNAWFYVFKSVDFKFPKTVRDFIEKQQMKIKEPRHGTVGYHVKHKLSR